MSTFQARTLHIDVDLSVTGEVADQEMADEFIEWLLEISDVVRIPSWLMSFDGAEAKRDSSL